MKIVGLDSTSDSDEFYLWNRWVRGTNDEDRRSKKRSAHFANISNLAIKSNLNAKFFMKIKI